MTGVVYWFLDIYLDYKMKDPILQYNLRLVPYLLVVYFLLFFGFVVVELMKE
jgi:hypothetical protein